MSTRDLQPLSATELTARLTEQVKAYGTLHEAVRSGQEKNHTKLKQQRREIARLKTVLRQRT